MARQTPFTVYDLGRKKTNKLGSPPSKISESRLSDEWRVARVTRTQAAAESKKVPSRKRKKTLTGTKAKSTKVPKSAAELLRSDDGEDTCMECCGGIPHLKFNSAIVMIEQIDHSVIISVVEVDKSVGGEYTNAKSCGKQCLRDFRKENFPAAKDIDIRGPGPLGYSAFLAPKADSIPKDAFIGEYLGELRPLDAQSLYRFVVPGVCVIDAEPAGNWTRFINSHCKPNVKPWAGFIGKRHVILFQTLKEINAGDEIVFNYGADYFKKAGFKCGCDALGEEHLPGGLKKTAATKKAKVTGKK